MSEPIQNSSELDDEAEFSKALNGLQAGNLEEAELKLSSLTQGRWAADAYKSLGDVYVRQRRYARAIDAYRSALAARPVWPEVHNNLGNVHKLRGNLKAAEENYSRALASNPRMPDANNNLGVLLAERGELEAAASRFRAAASAKGASLNLGMALLQLNRVEEAVPQIEGVLAANPDDLDARIGAVRLRIAQHRLVEALDIALDVIRTHPACQDAHVFAGQLALRLGKKEDSLLLCRNGVEFLPMNPSAHEALGSALLASGEPQEAEVHFRRALELKPNVGSTLVRLGNCRQLQDRPQEAIGHYRAALSADPQSTPALNSLGHILMESGKPAEALPLFERACELRPNDAVSYTNVAASLNELGRHMDALVACRRAVELNPALPEAFVNLGAIHRALGSLDESESAYRAALALNPNLAQALFSLSTLRVDKLNPDHVEHVTGLLKNGGHTKLAQAQLEFSLAYVHEADRDFDAAFDAATRGNKIHAAEHAYGPSEMEQLVSDLKATFTPAFFEQRQSFGSHTDRPIFVVGAPRSGTTLIEQVLASHSKVSGGGEMLTLPNLLKDLKRWGRVKKPYPRGLAELEEPDVLRLAGAYRRAVRQIAGSGMRVTDKLPSNVFNLGAVAVLFPNAKIVFCHRDPLDTFISNYFMLFRSVIPFTLSQEHFAHYYEQQTTIMSHWRSVLPINIHELEYETFVAQQKDSTKKLLEYCELEWDDNCMNFHRTTRPVRTGSDVQVRRPLYATSVGRASPYLEKLGPLRASLQARSEIP